MKVLSIIIPSYNSESFIDANMKSFLDERLFESVEILLINDGSKDQTKQKIEYYENKYPEFIRAINKDNGGHGSVINVGICAAKGKYFKVIDADDWVDTENLVKLVGYLTQHDVDLVINPFVKIDQNSRKTILCGTIKDSKYTNREISFSKLIQENYRLTLHSITIKTSILRLNNIKYTEKCFYEDFQYTFFALPYYKNVTLFDYPVYYYLVGQKSQSVNASNGLKNVSMYLTVIDDSLKYYSKIERSVDTETRLYMENCLCDFIRSLYNIFLRNKVSKKVYSEMNIIADCLKNMSVYFYNEVDKRNGYIRLIRKGYLFFVLISYVFKIYKRKDIS